MDAIPTTASFGDDPPVRPLSARVILSHHWLVRERGGEKVLRAFRALAPAAPIYTLLHDPAGVGDDWPTVYTSWLQHLPGARRHYPKLLALLPAAARSIRLPPADLVLCSDAAIAKAMRPDPASKLICYCHSPMRYVWDLEDDYRRTLPPPFRPLWGPLCKAIRKADAAAAGRVDQFVANSRHVAARIRRSYGRDSAVIYPPVDVPSVPPTEHARDDFYAAVGYHVSYKRLDLAVAATRVLGRRLVVVGEGPDVDRVDRAANPHVEFRGWCSGAEIAAVLQRARGLLFPGEEDFGIVPVEALAHGCPVIAYGMGGATETVIPDRTGVWFSEQSVACVIDGIERAERLCFNPQQLYQHAWTFRRARFLRELRDLCGHVLAAPR